MNKKTKKKRDRESEHAVKNINILSGFEALTLFQTKGHIMSTRKGCPNQLLGGSAGPGNIIWESHDIHLASRTFFAVMYQVGRVSICQRLFFLMNIRRVGILDGIYPQGLFFVLWGCQ